MNDTAVSLDEVALLREARAALGTAPQRALALTNQHRESFPDGLFVEEREVIAIDALHALGRNSGARAQRFFSRWPRSAHRAHLEELVGPQ